MFAIACAHAQPKAPLDVEPPTSHVIDVPPVTDGSVEPPGLAHIMRGLYFMQHGHASAAIPHFRLALIYDEDSAYLHQKLAEAWVDEGRIDKATEALDRGLLRAPDDPHLSTLSGELARRSGDYATAVTRFTHGLGEKDTVSLAGPGAVDAQLWTRDFTAAERTAHTLANTFSDDENLAVLVGNAYEDHGQLEHALAEYRRARSVKPSSREAALGESRVLEMQGKTIDAATTLVSLFQYAPDEVPLFTHVMRLYLRAGSPSAEAYKAEALRIAGDETVMRVIIANGFIVEGEIEPGVEVIREIGRQENDQAKRLAIGAFIADHYVRVGLSQKCLDELGAPVGIPEILRTRGNCLGGLGRVEDALFALAKSRAEGGRPRELAFDAARIAATSDDETRARRELDAYLKATLTDRYDATLARAVFAQHIGRDREAAGLISSLYGSTTPDVDLRLRWADALARVERVDESLAILRALVSEQPDDPTRLNALGFTLVEAGRNLDEAEVYLRHAYRLAPDEMFIIDSLGWLLHVRGQDAIAQRLLERAVRGSPSDPEILMHLGEVYKTRGKRDEAHALFAKAAQSQPPRNVKTKLDRLLKEKQ